MRKASLHKNNYYLRKASLHKNNYYLMSHPHVGT